MVAVDRDLTTRDGREVAADGELVTENGSNEAEREELGVGAQ